MIDVNLIPWLPLKGIESLNLIYNQRKNIPIDINGVNEYFWNDFNLLKIPPYILYMVDSKKLRHNYKKLNLISSHFVLIKKSLISQDINDFILIN